MARYTLDDLARLVDHTNLHPDATREDMKKLCQEAKDYHFMMVAINSVQSKLCSELLAGTDIHTGAAIGFPLGQTTIATKVFETKDALANGANEIDYVVNLTEVKAGNWDYIKDEMEQIVAVCREADVTSKVIFENCLLTQDEKLELCKIASEVLPTFVKTPPSRTFASCASTSTRVLRLRPPAASARPTRSSTWSVPAPSALAAVRAFPSSMSCAHAWRARASTPSSCRE